MKYVLLGVIILLSVSCNQPDSQTRTKNFPTQNRFVEHIPNNKNVWVFIMAGQSNMAGRAFVEPQDTIESPRILTINKNNRLVYAKEPLHFYEPSMTGLDMGLAFGKEIIKNIPDSISVMLIPTAVGGSTIDKWLTNKKHRHVELLKNFEDKVALGSSYGTIKGVLWHQGESDTKDTLAIVDYDKKMSQLFKTFRKIINNKQLPIIVGEIGAFSNNKANWKRLNSKIRSYSKTDDFVDVISTSDLSDRGDLLHFDSKSIRILGERYAKSMMLFLSL